MQFKRLNNMTGSDPLLNRRITSIYINEFEALRNAVMGLGNAENTDCIVAALHKMKPGMVIFDHDEILPKLEALIRRKQQDERIEPGDYEVQEILTSTNQKIDQLKTYLKSIN